MSIYGRYAYYHMGYCCFVRHWKTIKYYADYHDVDEELRTIASQGENWSANVIAGIMMRFVFDSPTNVFDTVAYKDKNTTLSARVVFLMI